MMAQRRRDVLWRRVVRGNTLARHPLAPPAPQRGPGGGRGSDRALPRRAHEFRSAAGPRAPRPAAGLGERRLPRPGALPRRRRGCRRSACRSSRGWPTGSRWRWRRSRSATRWWCTRASTSCTGRWWSTAWSRSTPGVTIFPWVTIGLRAGDVRGATVERGVSIGTGAKLIGPVRVGAGATDRGQRRGRRRRAGRRDGGGRAGPSGPAPASG